MSRSIGTYSAKQRHALAALALHDQPFGFTWRDVELREIGRDYEARFDDDPDSEEWDHRPPYERFILAHNLADRVAALLRPKAQS